MVGAEGGRGRNRGVISVTVLEFECVRSVEEDQMTVCFRRTVSLPRSNFNSVKKKKSIKMQICSVIDLFPRVRNYDVYYFILQIRELLGMYGPNRMQICGDGFLGENGNRGSLKRQEHTCP